MTELLKFRIRQWIFITTILSISIGLWFVDIPNLTLDIVLSILLIIGDILLFLLFLNNLSVEMKNGKGLYLFNPPKKITTIDRTYWVKILKTGGDNANEFDIHLCEMGLFTWGYIYYDRVKVSESTKGDFNRIISGVINKYRGDFTKNTYFKKEIFSDFNQWDGIVGSESDLKILKRSDRFDKLLDK